MVIFTVNQIQSTLRFCNSKISHLPAPWIECDWILEGFRVQLSSRSNKHYSPASWDSVSWKFRRPSIKLNNFENVNSGNLKLRIGSLPLTWKSFRAFLNKPGGMLEILSVSLTTICVKVIDRYSSQVRREFGFSLFFTIASCST